MRSRVGAYATEYPQEKARITNGPTVRRILFPIIGLLIVIVSTMLQRDCIHHELVIDDFQLVQNADDGRGCGNNAAACFSGKLFHLYYRPMLTASFAIVQQFHLHNDDPKWFHIENLVLHAIVVAMAIWLFRLILRRRSAALVSGALFGLHPVQVAITTFIGGRTDLLALMFMFTFAIGICRAASLLRAADRVFYARYRRLTCAFVWIAITAVAFLAAVFTKEQVIPLVMLCPLLLKSRKVLRLRSVVGAAKRNRISATTYLPPWLVIYLVPIIIYSVASRRVLKDDVLPHPDWSTGLHIEMVGRTIWYFAKTLFAPTVTTLHQSTFGPWDTHQYFVAFLGYLCAGLWLIVLARVWPNRKQRFMALWASLTLVTCLNLIPIPSTFASPYRAAIPLFGMAGLAGSLLVELPSKIRRTYQSIPEPELLISTAFIAVLSWCIFTSCRDVPKWTNETTLMKAEVAADPNYIPARAALANYIAAQHTPDYARSLEQYNICIDQLFDKNTPESAYASLYHSKQLLRQMQSGSGPRYTTEYIGAILRCRGWDYQSMGKFTEAIEDYKTAIFMSPDDQFAIQNLSTCYRLVGEIHMDSHDYRGAIEQFRAGLTINPNDKSTRESLIAAYRIVGDKGKADAVFRMEDRFMGRVP